MSIPHERIIIFDTTLRDGEQSPGASMDVHEKVLVAKQLEALGVDKIEAGFPISSPGDFDAVQAVAGEIKKSMVIGLCRARDEDIHAAWNAVKDAAMPGIHTFIATSDIHLKYQLNMSPDEVLRSVERSVSMCRSLAPDVEFSAMDATRSDWDFLVDVYSTAIASGAGTINVPDTVGYTMPEEFTRFLTTLYEKCPTLSDVTLSVHCHNDLGLAVANSLAALRNGARQVECTINGIGERAGNTAMEEVVMALQTRKDLFGLHTNIKTNQIYKTSRLLTQITGIPVQPNKAIVGANAFAHESGIHQDGLIKEKITYEIMTPQSVGISDTHIVLGKHSGRNAISHHLKKMGYQLNDEQINKVAARVKELADIKKDIYDEDLEVILSEEIYRGEDKYSLLYLNVVSGNVAIPTATMEMQVGKDVIRDAGFGNGPVDATFAAIRNITKTNYLLLKYAVNAITGGSDAQGETMVQLKYNGHSVIGRGAHPDVIVASAKAYINALNRLEFLKDNAKKVKLELS